ncbi:MAG: hypothetical protein IJQ73_08490, partial [Kiritimatiellae bacterium]|nr:hypothetical protein [Kiritimatiellia bacterium]
MRRTTLFFCLLACLAGPLAAETPREVLDKTQFANKVWDAIPMLLEERRAKGPDVGLDEEPGEEPIALEETKAAYDWSKPPKGEWGQCKSVGDRTLNPVSRTSGNVVEYPPVGDFRKESSRSTWYRNEMAVPAAWRGRQIRIYAWLWGMDALVYVNGKKAGRILRPRADVDVTDLVTPGEKCTVEVLMSTDRVRDEAQRKWFEERYWKDWLCHQFEFRSYDGSAYLTDVFANASVRGKKLTLESEINCRRPGEYRLKATFTDSDGKVAKTLDEKLVLGKGIQTVKPVIPWDDPHLWELRAPYLYNCEVVLCDAGGEPLDRYPAFRFGFREVYREGRQLFINGHPLCLRGLYANDHSRKGVETSIAMGCNLHLFPHNTESFTDSYQQHLDLFDEMGFGAIGNAPNVQPLGGALLTNPEAQAEYRRQMQMMLRTCRNHPSVLGHHISCNFSNPRYNQFPWLLARDHEYDSDGKPMKGLKEQVLDMGAQIGRAFNPNVIFYGHADGNGGDISGANLYLNWTPMQEREDWFSTWAKDGDYPYQAAEYGPPYWACWWAGGAFFPIEQAAREFGDAAYTEMETDGGMQFYNVYDHTGWGNTLSFMCTGPFPLHGLDANAWKAFYPRAISATNCPAFWNYRELVALRSNRAFRADGVSGGVFYFNIGEHYEATNRAFQVQSAGNQDLLAYIGGWPRHTNKTHAYAAGEKVEKQLVTIWDNPHADAFSVVWSCRERDSGKVVASGSAKASLGPGARQFDAFSFDAPAVAKKTYAVLEATWSNAKGEKVASDSFTLAFYPQVAPDAAILAADATPLALFDPEGGTEPLLKKLGLKYRKIGGFTDAAGEKRIVIGEFALKGEDYALLPEDFGKGLRVLILRQAQSVWTSLGLRTENTVSRRQFRRDAFEPAFADVTDDELAYWRGTPTEYDALPFANIHPNRGPRWLKTHSVSGYSCVVPNRLGWHTYIDGEFGLQYGSFLCFNHGQGGLYLTTLDFGSNLDDPAAMKVAAAVFKTFAEGRVDCSRQVVPCGERLAKYSADHLFVEDGAAADDSEAVYFVGDDAAETFAELKAKCERGANVLVCANARIAGEAGIVFRKAAKANGGKADSLLRKDRLYRIGKTGTDPFFRGVGPALLRWRYGIDKTPIASAPAEFKLDADGYAAIASFGKGKFVYVIEDPVETTGADDAFYSSADLAGKTAATTLISQLQARKFSEFLRNLGANSTRLAAERVLYRFPVDAAVAPAGADGKTGAMKVADGRAEFAIDCGIPYEAELRVGSDRPFRLVRDGQTLVVCDKAVGRAGWPVRVALEKGANRFAIE